MPDLKCTAVTLNTTTEDFNWKEGSVSAHGEAKTIPGINNRTWGSLTVRFPRKPVRLMDLQSLPSILLNVQEINMEELKGWTNFGIGKLSVENW